MRLSSLLTPPVDAVTVAGVDTATTCVGMVKTKTVAPAGTVTVGDGCAAALELESVTTAPPTGAGPSRVALAVPIISPPLIDVGLAVNACRTGGFTVTIELLEPPP